MKTLLSMFIAAALSLGALAAGLSANGIVVDGEVSCEQERREFDDGSFAVRYIVGEGAGRVSREDTEWRLPVGATVWFQPGGGMEFIDYEAPYKTCKVADLRAGQLMAMPVTAKLPGGGYRVMTEANVVDWTDSALVYRGDGRFAIHYYADRDGFEKKSASTSPWRVMLAAADLQALAANDIVRRLCPETTHPLDRRFAPSGRCIWHWLAMGDPVLAEQRDWYDKTARLGFEYYLIDEGWRKWGDDQGRWQRLKECIDYGKSKGVGTFVWVDSKEMRTRDAARAYLAKVAAVGAVGIKIDFFPAATADTMRRYEELLEDTYAAGLRVDFHGCVKPSGREKTWPHEIAREAIRGHEWHITRYHRVLDPSHDAILPFCRLVQGHGDYTPLVFTRKELVHFTWARELAQAIVFACPFLCFGDYPQEYLANPAVELIKALPAEYDETRVLAGSEIGECVALARRKGETWFVAVENGAKEREIVLDFSFLSRPVSATAYGDSPDGRLDAYAVETYTATPGMTKTLRLRPCGGYAAMLK